MKKALLMSFLTLFIGVTAFSVDADARRFGGGKSFGKSFSQQKSFAKPVPKQNLAGKAAPGSRAGGMMGILGGLAMGGLLGALFFGGAFEGLNLMDILIFAGIAFILFRLFRGSASQRQQEYAHAGQGSPLGNHEEPSHHDTFMGATQNSASVARPDIDVDHFIAAARDIFMRMQADWDAKNLDDIRAFCTADVAANIETEMAEYAGTINKTEVAMLEASIVETWLESNLEWVAVDFNALLKEETLSKAGEVLETENNQVNETWIFQHDPRSEDPTWYLAGIQQA